MNFSYDYQMLRVLSPTQLSTLLDAQLVRLFLVVRVLRENHVKTLGRMKFGVFNMGKHTREGGVALEQMNERKDHLKAFVGEATEEKIIQ